VRGSVVRFLRARNQQGYDIYLLPYAEQCNAGYILIDLDHATADVLPRMRACSRVHLEHRWQFWVASSGPRLVGMMEELPFAHAWSPSSPPVQDPNGERICRVPQRPTLRTVCRSYCSPSTVWTSFKASPFVVSHCSTIGAVGRLKGMHRNVYPSKVVVRRSSS
jgi:hypothetical protein